MMKTILVTGGAGFIGSHLCTKLVQQKHTVLCLDNFSTGAHINIAHLTNYSNFSIIEHDIIHPFDIKVDEIYNLACPASPTKYQANSIKTIETCVFGISHCLKLAKHYGAKILQASTSEVYGDPKEHPQRESYWGNVNPIGPRSCYDEGKRIAETLCSEYRRQYTVDTKIARIFNCYGPRMSENDGRIISNFIVQALKHDDITVYGKGTQTRSFCYIDDTIKGLTALMNTSKEIMGPVNIGNPKEYTIQEIAELIKTLTDSKSNIVYKDLPPDDPQKRKPDITQAEALLQWKPTIAIEKGLLHTIAYFKNTIKISK